MGRKRRYEPGVKYHVGVDRIPRRCRATVKPCPYQTHFDTYDDAQTGEPPIATSVAPEDTIFFSTGVNGASDGERPPLREASEKARNRFLTTGKRPEAPCGVITTHLPAKQKITLERETYDLPNDGGVGARYKLRYFENPKSYEQTTVNLNKPMDYALLCRKLEEYYAEAADKAALQGADANFDYMDNYDSTMQAITDVEVLTQGSGNLYKNLGLDLFSHDTPGTLTLRVDYDTSAIQSYDVADALKAHSVRDREVKEVAISISGSIPGSPDARWNLNRQIDGKWYVGSVSDKFTSTKELTNAEDGAKTLAFIFQKHGLDASASRKQGDFVHQMILEVEPKVKTYEDTIEMLTSRREQQARDYINAVHTPDKGPNDKLSGLFG